MKSLLIILGILWVGFAWFAINYWADNTKVSPPDNYTVSEMCPDGIFAKTKVSADGKKFKYLECPPTQKPLPESDENGFYKG